MGRYVRNVAAPAMPTREDFRTFADHARKLVDDEVSLRFGKSASDLNRLAEVLRTASARLDGTFTAPYFDSAAQQIDRAADMLKRANIGEMTTAAQRFARESPWLYIGGAIALGIGAGRFLRSSASSALPALPSSTTPAEGDARPAGTSRASSSARAGTGTRKQQRQQTFSNQRDES